MPDQNLPEALMDSLAAWSGQDLDDAEGREMAVRRARAHGPRMVAALVESGLLLPGEAPEIAVRRLVATRLKDCAGCAEEIRARLERLERVTSR